MKALQVNKVKPNFGLVDMRELAKVRCPNHYSVYMLRQCTRCWRIFEEHTARIAKLPHVGSSD